MGQCPEMVEAGEGFRQRGLSSQTDITAVGASCFSPPLVVGLTTPEQDARIFALELLFGHAFDSRF